MPEPGAVEEAEEAAVETSAPAAERVAEPETQSVAEPETECPDRRPVPAIDRASRTMRRDGPELWDLERNFERRHEFWSGPRISTVCHVKPLSDTATSSESCVPPSLKAQAS